MDIISSTAKLMIIALDPHRSQGGRIDVEDNSDCLAKPQSEQVTYSMVIQINTC